MEVYSGEKQSALYGPQSKYPGLYILGEAREGVDNIRNLSGKIEITKVDEE